jgi:predicted acetyltransferase
MITYANENQKQDIIHIWKTSFPDDSPQFVDLYFAEKYRKENTLVYIHEDKPISCLQMLPYNLTYYGNVCKTSYISGAATLPPYQNMGIMGELLSHSFYEMRNRGDIFTVLIPQKKWLIKFYQKYGYNLCFEYRPNLVQPIDISHSDTFAIVELNAVNIKEAYQYYHQCYSKQNLCILKSFDDFRIIWEDLKLASGAILLCYELGRICGICFCFHFEERVIVKDFFTDSKQAWLHLLGNVMNKYPEKKVYLHNLIFKDKGNIASKGMARILDAEKALTLYASYYPDMQITIKVKDNQITENNAVFRLHNGSCLRQNDETCDLQVSINKLTRLLFGCQIQKLPTKYSIFPSQHPYMSLMLD